MIKFKEHFRKVKGRLKFESRTRPLLLLAIKTLRNTSVSPYKNLSKRKLELRSSGCSKVIKVLCCFLPYEGFGTREYNEGPLSPRRNEFFVLLSAREIPELCPNCPSLKFKFVSKLFTIFSWVFSPLPVLL